MLIAIVEFSTTAADRPAALTHLDGERDRVRALPGSLAYQIYACRDDETRTVIVQEWADEASMEGYRRSDSFARIGEVLRPMMTGAPVSRSFRAELREATA